MDWQFDLYRLDQKWALHLCDEAGWRWVATCEPADANRHWVSEQLARQLLTQPRPAAVRVFRPQCLELAIAACDTVGLAVKATRQTPALKAWLREQAPAGIDPCAIELPPPQPVPTFLQAQAWQFGALALAELLAVRERLIPVRGEGESWPTAGDWRAHSGEERLVPGVVLYGEKKAMAIARWLAEQMPVALRLELGDPSGLVLDAGLADRWILATFTDPDVRLAGQKYQQRQQASQGLHWLMVQPDQSGMTSTALFLLPT